MESSDIRVYRRLAKVLRVGLSVSLVLLASGLVLGLAAGLPAAEGPADPVRPTAYASGLAFAGVGVMLALPVVQAVLAALTYWSQGEQVFALAAFSLVVVQCLALLAARL
jgi:uncharacterized membrane protein